MVNYRGNRRVGAGASVASIASRFISTTFVSVCAVALFAGMSSPIAAQTKAKGSTPSKGKTKGNKLSSLIKPVVLVYVPDNKGGVSSDAADIVADVYQSRLRATDQYYAVFFTRGLPAIQRGLMEQTFTADEIKQPYDNTQKAAKLTKAIGYKQAIVGSIDDYKFDPDTKQVDIILSARWLDFSGPTPKVVRVVTLTGTGDAKTTKGKDETQIALAVARATAEKLISDLLHPAAAKSEAK